MEACVLEIKKKWQHDHREYNQKRMADIRARNPINAMCQQIRRKCLKNNKYYGIPKREFSLTTELLCQLWNVQEGKCYWTRYPLSWNYPKNCILRPSVDRIDSSRGYTIDNVAWTLSFVNIGRGATKPDDFKEILLKLGFKQYTSPLIVNTQ